MAITDTPRWHPPLVINEKGMELWQVSRFDDPIAVLCVLLEAVVDTGHAGGDGETDIALPEQIAEVVEEFERRAHDFDDVMRRAQGQDRKSFSHLSTV